MQHLAGHGLLAMVEALRTEEAVLALLGGSLDVVAFQHGDAGFQHAPGDIAAAPLELVVLTAPFGILVHIAHVPAVHLQPLVIGDVQYALDFRRRRHRARLDRDRRRRGIGRQGSRAEDAHQQDQGDHSHDFLHQDDSFHGSPSIIPRFSPNGKKGSAVFTDCRGMPW